MFMLDPVTSLTGTFELIRQPVDREPANMRRPTLPVNGLSRLLSKIQFSHLQQKAFGGLPCPEKVCLLTAPPFDWVSQIFDLPASGKVTVNKDLVYVAYSS